MSRQPVPLPWQSAPSPKKIVLEPPQAGNNGTNSQGVSAVPPQADSSGQRTLMPRQPVPLPKQLAQTQGASTPLPQASQASSQANSANNPWRSPRGNSLEDPNPKWVINLSTKPLTQTQRSVLAKGPNFALTPRNPPNLEYITAIESVGTKLGQQDAEELKAEINSPKLFPPPQT